MPLPPGARAGTLPNGTLVWIDANGQPINADGTPMANAPAATPLAPAPNTAASSPTSTQTAPTTVSVDIAPPGSGAAPTPAPTPTPAPATTTTTGPAAGPPSPGTPSAGGYTVSQITAQSDQELLQANADVAKLWDDIHAQQQTVATLSQSTNPLDQQKLTAATSQLNAQYGSLSSAMQRVETANASRATTLQKAIDASTLDPSQVELAKAQATKATTDSQLSATQRDVLEKGSQGQRDLVAAQATQASATAAASLATAASTTAKTPAEIDQLKAQAAALNAQATQTTALLPGLIDKQKAEIGLTTAQTDLTGSQSTLAKAQATQATANAGLADAQAKQTAAQTTTLLPAQAGLATAQGNLANAQAAGAAADIQQKRLGPVYGLQDQLAAIKSIHDQVFGPGGSGTPDQRRQQADDLLSQFFNATVGGTTPYAASVAAENANLTGYGTQMSGVNALQAAQASRASSYAGLAGSELGTLAGMNAYAPKGSTSMADAFQYLQDDMAKRMAAQFPTAPIPNAPALPAYLQQFGAPAQGGPAGPGGAPVTAGAPAGNRDPGFLIGGPTAVNQDPGFTARMNGVLPGGPVGAGAGDLMSPQQLAALQNTTGQPGGAQVAGAAPAAAPGGPPATLPGMFTKYWQQQYPSAAGQPATGPVAGLGGLTPQQAFNQGFQANTPSFPNVLQMYGLNMPNPMTLLGGQPYVGMPV